MFYRDECKAQIEGHPYAKYKKFSTLKEAEAFVGAKQTPPDAAAAPLRPSTLVTSPSANGSGESKSLLKAYYAVQAGRTPGVYESWYVSYFQFGSGYLLTIRLSSNEGTNAKLK